MHSLVARHPRLFVGWLLCVVIAVIYSNSLWGDFIFDDANSVVDNGTIRELRNLPLVLAAPPRGGSTTDARPLVNLSLAINFALHGLNTTGYHLFNIVLHMLNTLLVLQLLYTLFAGPLAPVWLKSNPILSATVCTALWCLHPIHTSVVSYISQRAESMAAMFYLLVLNTDLVFKRGSAWRALSPVLLVLGGLCKETIVTAPLVSFLLQRWYFNDSWSTAWRYQRQEVALKIVALVPVITMAFIHGGRSGTAATGGISSLDYLLAQGYLIPRYWLSLIVPGWVCTDYGLFPPGDTSAMLLGCLVLASLLLTCFVLVLRNRAAGLAGLAAAIFLAPSSSLIPITTQIGGEHRVYLPSLAFFVWLVLSANWLAARFWRLKHENLVYLSVGLFTLIAVSLGVTTYSVNRFFSTLPMFWERVVVMAPYNLRARQNLAVLDLRQGNADKAFGWFTPLLANKRQCIAARLEAADICEQVKMLDKAREFLEPILKNDPSHIEGLIIEARLRLLEGRPSEAVQICQSILNRSYTNAAAWNVMGRSFRLLSQNNESTIDVKRLELLDRQAETAILKSLELVPWSADSRFTLAGLYLDQGRDDEAERELRNCLLYQPTRAEAWYWLAAIHLQKGNRERAFQAVHQSLAIARSVEAEELARKIGVRLPQN